MNHLRSITLSILGMAVCATLPGTGYAQIAFVNPTSLINTAINDPSAVAMKAKDTLTTGLVTAQNATMKDIGGGYSVTSLGVIINTATKNPVALIAGDGSIISSTQNKLDVALQSQLNGLMRGVSLPAGMGSEDRTPATFVQKNTYAAATDNPDVYYGGGGAGSVGFGSVGSIVSAVVSAAATGNLSNVQATVLSAQNSAMHVLSGSNQIVDGSGVVVANFNPATAQFTTTSGSVIAQDSAQYQSYQAVLSSAGTATASLNVNVSVPLP